MDLGLSEEVSESKDSDNHLAPFYSMYLKATEYSKIRSRGNSPISNFVNRPIKSILNGPETLGKEEDDENGLIGPLVKLGKRRVH